MTRKILITTPVEHLDGVLDTLSSAYNSELVYIPSARREDLMKHTDAFAIFTNPNKSRILYSQDILSFFKALKVFCTASTGTNHVDKSFLHANGITLLSLTDERDIINSITSTAEHAFALMLAALRKIPAAYSSVSSDLWDYQPFIGRQLSNQSVGIVGYGRLGNYFAQYLQPFGCNVSVFDPYKDVPSTYVRKVKTIKELFQSSNIVSLHVHVNEETVGMINESIFEYARHDLLLVNTSRSDIVNEQHIADFLARNRDAKYATDVLSSELSCLLPSGSPLFNERICPDQLIVTPHIAGMTIEGQTIAFNHAASMLSSFMSAV